VDTGVYLMGFGASTAIGRDAWRSAAAARAGIGGFSMHPFLLDTVGEPIRIACRPGADLERPCLDRCEEMLADVIDEVLSGPAAPLLANRRAIGLHLALPTPRPGWPEDAAARLLGGVSRRHANVFRDLVPFAAGHAAGYLALDAAMRDIAALRLDACVLVGVDSYLTAETLEWLEAEEQLHGAGRSNNAWGFIPGEAAGALLIVGDRFAAGKGEAPFGEVIGVGLGREANRMKTAAVCTGDGLTRAFRAALDHLPAAEQVQNVYCDMNGETYRADEYGFTALRVKERVSAPTDFVAPADCWGDIGAASAPLHVMLALIAHRKRYSKGPVSLAWASSEAGDRGAVVVHARSAEGV
jgi:3-oxoacyl-[acyl-carrier-protein] synthase-1